MQNDYDYDYAYEYMKYKEDVFIKNAHWVITEMYKNLYSSGTSNIEPIYIKENEIKQKYHGSKVTTINSAPAKEKEKTQMAAVVATPAAVSQELKFKDCSVHHSEDITQIAIPTGMLYREAIVWIERAIKLDEEIFQPNVSIPCYPFDGIIAFHNTIKKLFGFVSVHATPGFFGPTPPTMLTIQTGVNSSVDVPVGKMKMQGIDGDLEVFPSFKDSRPALVITGTIKRKSQGVLNKLVSEMKEELKNNSIYKHKAIIIGKRADELSNRAKSTAALPFGMDEPPVFMNPTGLSKSSVVLNKNIYNQVNDLLWTPIEKSAACREYGVPLKRGILLSGPYGTGKSLTAAITSEIAVKNGWTFINLANIQGLSLAIDIAKWYQPAIIFAEDVDFLIGTQDRDENTNNILNVVDGIDKDRDVFVVLTTNHVEKINKAFLRPGRLDAVIEFEKPDSKSAERLMKIYGCGLIDENEDISAAAEIMVGTPAAMCREVVERAKLSAIGRSGHANKIIGSDLETSANSLISHVKLLEGQKNNMSPAMRNVGDMMLKATASIGKHLYDSEFTTNDLDECSLNGQY